MSSVSATPKSRGSHINSNDAIVRNAFPKPVSPFCRSVGVYCSNDARNAAGSLGSVRAGCSVNSRGVRNLPVPPAHAEAATANIAVNAAARLNFLISKTPFMLLRIFSDRRCSSTANDVILV